MKPSSRIFISAQSRRLGMVSPLRSGKNGRISSDSFGRFKRKVPYVSDSILEYVPFREDMEPQTYDLLASEAAGEDIAKQHESPTQEFFVVSGKWNIDASIRLQQLSTGLLSVISWALLRGGARVYYPSNPNSNASTFRQFPENITAARLVTTLYDHAQQLRRNTRTMVTRSEAMNRIIVTPAIGPLQISVLL